MKPRTSHYALTTPRHLGSLIGAVFGLVYLLANASPLPSGAAISLRGLAVIAFIVVLWAIARSASGPEPTGARGFGPGYWPIVTVEVAALAVGLSLVDGPLDVPRAAVAWVSFVVGAHFLALAVAFDERLFRWIGGAIGACGLAGLALAAAGSGAAAIATVSGLIPGAVLLASAWWGTRPGSSQHH